MRRLLLLMLAASPIVALAAAPASAATRPVLRVEGGLKDKGRHYVVKRQRVRVVGTAAGVSSVQVELLRGSREVRSFTAPVRGGRFVVHVTLGRTGTHAFRARATDDAGESALSRRRGVHVIVPGARAGARGRDARLLQRGLRALGFAAPLSGRYDAATGRGVLAFRKTNKMRRRTSANATVLGMLFRGQGAYKLRYPRAGKHVEFDWSRQVLVLARSGRADRVYHASSGAPATPTVFGTFRFYRRQWGTNAKGMVHSSYFIRGYAIHGYKSVPNHPASHGCIRVPIPSSRSIAQWIKLGDRIFVYR